MQICFTPPPHTHTHTCTQWKKTVRSSSYREGDMGQDRCDVSLANTRGFRSKGWPRLAKGRFLVGRNGSFPWAHRCCTSGDFGVPGEDASSDENLSIGAMIGGIFRLDDIIEHWRAIATDSGDDICFSFFFFSILPPEVWDGVTPATAGFWKWSVWCKRRWAWCCPSGVLFLPARTLVCAGEIWLRTHFTRRLPNHMVFQIGTLPYDSVRVILRVLQTQLYSRKEHFPLKTMFYLLLT